MYDTLSVYERRPVGMSGVGWTSGRQHSHVYPRRGRVEGGGRGEGYGGQGGGVPLGRGLDASLGLLVKGMARIPE